MTLPEPLESRFEAMVQASEDARPCVVPPGLERRNLAAQHSRELTTQATAARARARQARPGRPRRRLASPYHITWTRVRLALSDGGRARTSWTIVISATRAR